MRDCVGGEQSARIIMQARGALRLSVLRVPGPIVRSTRHASWHLMLMVNVNGALTCAVFLLVCSLITVYNYLLLCIARLSLQYNSR